MTARILIFAKAPVPGRVKTRLIPALGAEGAAALARRMLERTVEEAVGSGLKVELCADPEPTHRDWKDRLPAVAVSAQGPGDLGDRLSRAAARATGDGEPAILVGTDCPEMDSGRLRTAAELLGRFDAVLHPAADGGYALLGLRRSDPLLFDDIPWSTGGVARATTDRIGRLGWSLHVGEVLRDIDEPADLD